MLQGDNASIKMAGRNGMGIIAWAAWQTPRDLRKAAHFGGNNGVFGEAEAAWTSRTSLGIGCHIFLLWISEACERTYLDAELRKDGFSSLFYIYRGDA